MENNQLQIVCYYHFEKEEGIIAKSRLFCTKCALYRYPVFEIARKLQGKKESKRYSPQYQGGLYVTITPPKSNREHYGAYPHHSFRLAATKKENKKQSSLYDPKHTQKYSFGDMDKHSLLFIFSDDFLWGNDGEIISGKIEVLVFGCGENLQNEIYQKAIKGDFDAEIDLLRKISITDKPLAKNEGYWKIRINSDSLNFQEISLPHLTKLSNAYKKEIEQKMKNATCTHST